ncbi:MAG: insulinase family protein [Candidatus Marinimicrobia bacterium]|nr:insulinase family protein [Candidatus Neomarinimicrobiota bacterium]MBT4593984.1 insulinase family protein [Candidatus Neomarinimicrobiota bacterium]
MKEIDPKDKPALTALSLILKDKIVFDIREKQGMAYRMHAGISLIKNKALFSINFGTRPENVDVLVPQFPDFFSMSMLNDVDEASLEKSVNMYLGRMMFRRLSSINQAYYLGHSLYFDGDMNSDSEFLEGLKAVSLKDVKRVAKKYMNTKNPISITVR